jgi:hypothetical protein
VDFEVEQKLALQLHVLVCNAHRHMCHQQRLQVLVLILPNQYRLKLNAGGRRTQLLAITVHTRIQGKQHGARAASVDEGGVQYA